LPAVRDFYRLLRQTRQRHGMPPQPFAFFANLQRHILAPNHGRVVLARLGRVAVAGAVFLQFGRTALFKFGASDESFQNLRANNLVMWRAIQWHVQRGFESLDFGRTSLDNEGLRRFKLSWGTQERTIEYLRYELRAERFVTSEDRSSGWHNRLFRRLPGRISQLIGAGLYRHLG
jgi:lipid II:glycine glycyltransferase (peptidoglycan interpeptide bridge formation enzyme)